MSAFAFPVVWAKWAVQTPSPAWAASRPTTQADSLSLVAEEYLEKEYRLYWETLDLLHEGKGGKVNP